MKTAILGINGNLIQSHEQDKMISYLKKRLYEIGEDVSLISYFNNHLDTLKQIINNNYDLVFCIGTEQTIYNYNIKENICKIVSDKLEKHATCENLLKKYCLNNNIPFSNTEEMETFIPSKGIPLCNENYFSNGFMYKYNNTYIIYLPSNHNFMIQNFNDYILPLIKDISTSQYECLTIRCYGILEKDIRSILAEEFANTYLVIQIFNERLDNAIYIRYSSEHSQKAQDVLASICTKLNRYIYATEDTSLYDTAQYLLNLHKKHISVAETLTMGNITRKLSEIDRNIITNTYLFNNFDDIKRSLGLNQKVIDNYGNFSVNTVYELDNLLLEKTNTDIAIFVLGDLDMDTCYIAIGDLDGIHVYKNKIVCKNDESIDNISDTALFYLIKKLRQNDLQFR